MSQLNLLPQQMMPAAIGNPPCISNPVVTAAVSQPLAVEKKRMQVELNDKPLDLRRGEHMRATGVPLPDVEVVEMIDRFVGALCIRYVVSTRGLA